MGTRQLGTVFGEARVVAEVEQQPSGLDFLEHRRAPVREAVLVATEVDVPHAGRP